MADVSRAYPVESAGPSLAQRLIAGGVGGLVGGMVFGMMMGMMGMLPMVAMLVHSESAGVGFVVHMVISAVIGAGFGLAFSGRAATLQAGALWGAVYGLVWWMLGPLLIMPTMLGMGPQFGMALTMPMMMSLVGHLIFGVVAGLAYPLMVRRLTLSRPLLSREAIDASIAACAD